MTKNEYRGKLIKQLFENDCKKMEKQYGDHKLKIASKLIYGYFANLEVVLTEDDNYISATIYVDKANGQKMTDIQEIIFWNIEFVAEYLGIDINLYVDVY